MDLEVICEILSAVQLTDSDVREKAEKKLDELAKSSPDQLVTALLLPLQAGKAVPPPVRQEAAVILRRHIFPQTRETTSVWDRLQPQTRKLVQAQLLGAVEGDECHPVRRSAGQAVAATIEAILDPDDDDDDDDIDDDIEDDTGSSLAKKLVAAWPEVLPTLSRFVSRQSESATRVVALEVLTELVPTIGTYFLSQQDAMNLLASLLAPDVPEPAEVRAEAAVLILTMVEKLDSESIDKLGIVMPALIATLQKLADEKEEESLKSVLEELSQAIDGEAEFFGKHGFNEIWGTLMKLSSVGPNVFADDAVRHSAMKAASSLAHELKEEFVTADGQVQLEAFLQLNLAWMLEVDDDVEAWTEEGRQDDEDDIDGEAVVIGEENLDQLAEDIAADIIMPLLFKVMTTAMKAPEATWKHTRACAMAMCQVVEHMDEEDDEAWVDRIIDFLLQHVAHPHPRVRYAAFFAIAQACHDQAPHVQEEHYSRLMPAVLTGMEDGNIRVACAAAHASVALIDDMDEDDLEGFMDRALAIYFQRLQAGGSRALQGHCLSGIAILAQASGPEDFVPHYETVMKLLHNILMAAKSKEMQELRSKAFECMAQVGSAVGAEVFAKDGVLLMEEIIKIGQAGFDTDDPFGRVFYDTLDRIFRTLGRHCARYVPVVLPLVCNAIKQQPVEINLDDDDLDDDDDDEMQFQRLGDSLYGLRTSVVEEMEEALDLLGTMIKELEEDFCEFLVPTCQATLPLLHFEISAEVQSRTFEVWGQLAASCRSAVDKGRLDIGTLRELVAEFLKKTISALSSATPGKDGCLAVKTLQAQADGSADIIRKAGSGLLPKDAVKDIAVAVLPLFEKFVSAGPSKKVSPDDDFGIDEESTWQTVRLGLASVFGAMMRTNPTDYLEVAFPAVMEVACKLIRSSETDAKRCQEDKAIGLCLASDAAGCLGEHTVRYWDMCMNDALGLVVDGTAAVRRYAAALLGHGSRQPAFTQSNAAPACVAQLHKVLRRRVNKGQSGIDAERAAMDACVRALGQLCENQEAQLGTDAPAAWNLWLSKLPLKHDREMANAAHEQLLSLVARGHPIVTNNDNEVKVLSIFAEIYDQHKRSSTSLDEGIAAVLLAIEDAKLTRAASSLPEAKAKKFQSVVKSIKKQQQQI